jgi:hypothetical protein
MMIETRQSSKFQNDSAPSENFKSFKDISRENLFRKSAFLRISLGTLTTTTISIFYALAHAKYRKFEFGFVKNWLKGTFTFSFLFYTGNEIIFSISNFYRVYTNFWINYTGLAYFLSKIHYRYLIRNHMMKWYQAIKYSHKVFLLFLVVNLILELLIFLTREIYLFEESDVFDNIREKFIDTHSNKPNFNMTYKDLEDNFMKSFHVINSKEKVKKIKEHLKKKNEKNFDSLEEYLNHKTNKHGSEFKIKTVNLYEMYKNKEI